MQEHLLKLNELVAKYGILVSEYENYRRTQSMQDTQKKMIEVTTAHTAIIMFAMQHFKE